PTENSKANETPEIPEATGGAAALQHHLAELRGESNLLFALLTAAATAPHKDQLTALRESLTATTNRLDRAFALTDDNAKAATQEKLHALLSFTQGPQNIIELRQKELGAAAEGQQILVKNRALAGRFSTAVEALVAGSQESSRSVAVGTIATIASART